MSCPCLGLFHMMNWLKPIFLLGLAPGFFRVRIGPSPISLFGFGLSFIRGSVRARSSPFLALPGPHSIKGLTEDHFSSQFKSGLLQCQGWASPTSLLGLNLSFITVSIRTRQSPFLSSPWPLSERLAWAHFSSRFGPGLFIIWY